MTTELHDALEDAIWQALDSEQGMPHSGVNPAFVIPEFLRLLKESGYTITPLPTRCTTGENMSRPDARAMRAELTAKIEAAIQDGPEAECGVIMRAYTWLDEDEDSPNPSARKDLDRYMRVVDRMENT